MFTIHEAERRTAWGPGASLRAPGGVQGQRTGGFGVSAFVKGPGRLSWNYLSQPKSSTERFQFNDTAHCVA